MGHRKIKILHLLPNLSGGGAERQLSYLAPNLPDDEFETHIAFLNGKAEELESFSRENIFLHNIECSGNYDPRILLQLAKIVWKVSPDIIQSWIVMMDIFAGILSLFFSAKWIVREPSSEFTASPLKEKLRIFLARRACLIIANSKGGKRFWQRYYPGKNIVVIPNGLPISEIDATEICDDVNRRDFILFVGRLTKLKNIDKLIKSFSDLENAQLELRICGDGEERSSLEDLCREYDVSQSVSFLGSVMKKDVWRLMKQAKCLLLLSDFEGLPNVVLEAMACRCPVIVSDIKAHRDFLNSNVATFVDPDNTECISSEIEAVCADDRTKMVEEARLIVQNYSVENMANLYSATYKNNI